MGVRARFGVVLAVIAALSLAPAAASGKRHYSATIRTTDEGIPRILAKSWGDLGFGYGYALASQDICTVADSYVTVDAKRSRYFGPDGNWTFQGNGFTFNNLDSDFFFQKVIDDHTIQKLLKLKPPRGPRPQVIQAARGYAAGYNRYLRKTGVANLPDPRCRGAKWVHPITVKDVFRRFYQLGLLASQGVAIDGIAQAAPPTPPLDTSAPAPSLSPDQVDELGQRLHLGIGSNAVALGPKGTKTGHGMLLGNPHFPWKGSERFFESQLTIPGKMNVSGASLLGVPVVLIGHTRHLAWSHTVSTAYRFTPYQLTLVPGSPTTYLYDGQPKQMKSETVAVKVKTPGGLEKRTHTFYSTIQGPMILEPRRHPAAVDANHGVRDARRQRGQLPVPEPLLRRRPRPVHASAPAHPRARPGRPLGEHARLGLEGPRPLRGHLGRSPRDERPGAELQHGARRRDVRRRSACRVLDGSRSACEWGSRQGRGRAGDLRPEPPAAPLPLRLRHQLQRQLLAGEPRPSAGGASPGSSATSARRAACAPGSG